jgi:4-amino-4-deoxy-L-arabinose transferase-like glycosyltransferase
MTAAAPNRAVIIAISIAFILRVGVAAAAYARTSDVQIFYGGDTDSYLDPARELVRSGNFATGGEPDVFRTPGYPLLLALGVAAGRPEIVTVALQILLSCATAYAVYNLARSTLDSERAAVTAVVLYAVDPYSVLYCSQLMTETLFTFLVTCAVVFLAQFLHNSRWTALTAASLLVSLSILVRPIGFLLPLTLAILVIARRRMKLIKRIAGVALLLLPSLAVISVWQWRNETVAGYPKFSAIYDINAMYQATGVTAELSGQSRELLIERANKYYEAKYPSTVKRYAAMRLDALPVLRAHPLVYLLVHGRGVLHSVFGTGANTYLRLFRYRQVESAALTRTVQTSVADGIRYLYRRALAAFVFNVVLLVVTVAYLGAAAIGIISWPHGKWLERAVILLPAVFLLLLAGLPLGGGRFRHPVMPEVCVFAACALTCRNRVGDAINHVKIDRTE